MGERTFIIEVGCCSRESDKNISNENNWNRSLGSTCRRKGERKRDQKKSREEHKKPASRWDGDWMKKNIFLQLFLLHNLRSKFAASCCFLRPVYRRFSRKETSCAKSGKLFIRFNHQDDILIGNQILPITLVASCSTHWTFPGGERAAFFNYANNHFWALKITIAAEWN